MNISETTKKNIFDELSSHENQSFAWYGKLDEIKFLNRLYKLKELPTSDLRIQQYPDMEADIRQHCINNDDWELWWIIDDKRLGLLNDDGIFLRFICETIHPVVRNEDEAKYLLNIYNKHLINDGIELVHGESIAKKSIYKAIEIDKSPIILENKDKFTRDFAIEQLIKSETKIKNNDYDGAITNSRSLIEDVIADIYCIVTKSELKKSGDLKSDYKLIKDLLNLAPEKHSNDSIKQIVRSFTTIIDGVDSLSNQMGDRHRRRVKPERHHAKLCVNSAKVITDFLYDTIEYQAKQKEALITQLIDLLNSDKRKRVTHYDSFQNTIRSLPRDELLNEIKVKEYIKKIDVYSRRMIIEELINNFEIRCWDDNDRFFGAMYILRKGITTDDVNRIKSKFTGNNQAVELKQFIKDHTRYEKRKNLN
ncbi:abortive infection family protein [Candidatus Parcubacteria bacterium]|nr:abortive infection family protein [Candidatus Parcubacteria bacterium]